MVGTGVPPAEGLWDAALIPSLEAAVPEADGDGVGSLLDAAVEDDDAPTVTGSSVQETGLRGI